MYQLFTITTIYTPKSTQIALNTSIFGTISAYKAYMSTKYEIGQIILRQFTDTYNIGKITSINKMEVNYSILYSSNGLYSSNYSKGHFNIELTRDKTTFLGNSLTPAIKALYMSNPNNTSISSTLT